jgi:hypothetical protein
MKLILFYVFMGLSILLTADFCRIEIQRRSPFVTLWLSLLFVILLPSLADPFKGVVYPHAFAAPIELGQDVLFEYSAYLLAILLSFRFFYAVFMRVYGVTALAPLSVAQDVSGRSNVGVLFYLLVVFSSVFAFIEVYQIYGVSFINQFGFTDRREGLSFLSGFLLSYPYMTSAGLALWFAVNKRYALFGLLVGLYLASYFLFGGSRQPIVALVIPFLLYPVMRRDRSYARFWLLLCAAALFSQVLDVMLYLRNLPGMSDRLLALADLPAVIQEISYRSGGEGVLRFALYTFIDGGAAWPGFFEFEYLQRALLFWLPSSIDFMGLKPGDFEYVMFANFMGGLSGTLHATLFGSIFADAGWLFLPWVLFLSAVFFFVPIYIQRFSGAAYFCTWSTLAFYGLMFSRGSLYGPLVVIAFALLFAHAVKFFSRFSFSDS